MKRVLLGTGSLSWPPGERRSDRYGTVGLFNEDSEDKKVTEVSINVETIKSLEGKKGKLIAKVIKQMESTHIGDLFRGIFPSTPELHAELELGEGTLFTHSNEHNPCYVGLMPDDGRSDDWLNPEVLYQAHEQIVELYFVEN